MRKHWLTLVVGGLAGIAMLAAACGPASSSTPTPGGANRTPIAITTPTPSGATPTPSAGETSVSGIPLDPQAKFGGSIVTTSTQEGPTFSNWEEAAGIPPFVNHKLLNQIVRLRSWGTVEDYTNNAFFEIHPDLAYQWEQSPDGLQWTFKLRDGVTWSDGTPLTCADAKWSLDSIRTGDGLNRSPRSVHFLAVDNIQCLDAHTLVINMKYPKPAMLEVVGMPYHVIMPKHQYEGNTDAMRQNPANPTTGAFTLRQWLPGEKYIFDRNPTYWDQPFPYLDSIEVHIVPRTAQTAAIRAGRIDVGDAHGYTGGQAETIVAECQVCFVWPAVIGSSQSPAIFLNKERAPWNDPAVNEAVALAIDNTKYVKVVQQDWSVVPTGCGFYPTSEWAMPAEQCKQIPGYGDFFPGGDPDADKDRARQILADAGYAPNELKVTVRFWSVIQADAPVIIEDLRAIGIDAEPEILETARAYDAWSSADFDIGVHSFWVAGLDPDITLYEHFYTGSDRNYNRYSNPEFDRLVDEMSQTVDPVLRKQRAWDVMEVALRDQAKIIVSHSTYVPIFNQRVRGIMPGPNYISGYGSTNRYDTAWVTTN